MSDSDGRTRHFALYITAVKPTPLILFEWVSEKIFINAAMTLALDMDDGANPTHLALLRKIASYFLHQMTSLWKWVSIFGRGSASNIIYYSIYPIYVNWEYILSFKTRLNYKNLKGYYKWNFGPTHLVNFLFFLESSSPPNLTVHLYDITCCIVVCAQKMGNWFER